jgi:hypothetical protein
MRPFALTLLVCSSAFAEPRLDWHLCKDQGGRGPYRYRAEVPTAADRKKARRLVRTLTPLQLATEVRGWWPDASDELRRQLLPTTEAALALPDRKALVDALAEHPDDQPSLAMLASLDRKRAAEVAARGRYVRPDNLEALRHFAAPSELVADLAQKGLVEPDLLPAALVGVLDALERAGRLDRIDMEADANPTDHVLAQLTALAHPAFEELRFTGGHTVAFSWLGRCARLTMTTPPRWHDLQALVDALNGELERGGAPGRLVILSGGQVFPIAYGPPRAFELLAAQRLIPPPQRIPADFAQRMEKMDHDVMKAVGAQPR